MQRDQVINNFTKCLQFQVYFWNIIYGSNNLAHGKIIIIR